jgi:hypothetical protein
MYFTTLSPPCAVDHKANRDNTGEEKKKQKKVSTADRTSQDGARSGK